MFSDSKYSFWIKVIIVGFVGLAAAYVGFDLKNLLGGLFYENLLH